MDFDNLTKNPFIRFIVLAGVLYIAWYALYTGYLNVHTSIDRLAIDNLIDLTRGILSFLEYDLIPEPAEADQIRTVGIDGTYGLWIGDPCNGINLFALFTIFIACYPGRIKDKIWFIPFGIITIHLINVIRIVALTIIVKIDYKYLDFNHDYTFTVIVYGYMFLLWIWWSKSYARLNFKKADSKDEIS